MNHILIATDAETEGGEINHNYKVSHILQAVSFGFKKSDIFNLYSSFQSFQ